MHIPLLAFLFSCRNPCQQLCIDLRDLAEECVESGELSDDYVFSDEMVKTCLKTQRKKERDQKKSCRSAIPSLPLEWTCQDLEAYFDDETGDILFGEEAASSSTGDTGE
jgi:hypothetical protein